MAATKQAGGTGKVPVPKRAGQLLARLKPHNPKKGYNLKKYTAFGILFREEAGWHVVDAHVAEYLKTVLATPDDPECALDAFDVCTAEEATVIHRRENEYAIRQGRAAPDSATDVSLTPRDVTSDSDMGPVTPSPPAATGMSMTTEQLRPRGTPKTRATSKPPPAAE